jgi:iron(III) transport system ATP-binding protein
LVEVVMIDVQGLVRRIGSKTILRDVSFQVAAGEVVAVLGPSGCGKSSTLRVLAGLDEANEGVVRMGGEVVDGPGPRNHRVVRPAERRGVAMVFQGYALWPHMSVADNIAYPLRQQRRSDVEVEQRVSAVLAEVQLSSFRDRLPATLSGGQQQRVALARALVARPPVLLLDEPLANLDAVLREELRGGLGTLARDSGAAVVLVTHDRAEAFALADRIVLLDAGDVVQVATPQALYRSPVSAFVMAFTGSMSALPAVRRGGVVSMGAQRLGISNGHDGEGVWCIRPEHVVLDGQAQNRMQAVVVAQRFLGDGFEVDLVLAGGSRIGTTWRQATPPALGSAVMIDLGLGCFFSATTTTVV